jgi:hypothetical protein
MARTDDHVKLDLTGFMSPKTKTDDEQRFTDPATFLAAPNDGVLKHGIHPQF